MTEATQQQQQHMYVCKSFSTVLDKDLGKNLGAKKKKDGETRKHKLNEMKALNMKQKK